MLKFKKILEKSGDFAQNLAKKLDRLLYEWVTFSGKIDFVWVYFQIPWQHIPTKTKLEYPPGPKMTLGHCFCILSAHFSEKKKKKKPNTLPGVG